MIKKFFFGVCVCILLLSIVSALGITPGRTTLYYEPGVSKTVSFKVLNSDKQDIDLLVRVQGELNESVKVSEQVFSMRADEAEKELSYMFEMPSSLSPGGHDAEVVVIWLPPSSGGSGAFVGATVGVATQLRVLVPYPNGYIESSLKVNGPDENNLVQFTLPVINRGTEKMENVYGDIDILDEGGKKVDNINLDEISLEAGEQKEIVAYWNASVTSGVYLARATLHAQDQKVEVEGFFTVGKRLLELKQVEVPNFQLGDIAKFDMLVTNTWNEPIEDAFAQMVVYDTSKGILTDVKSPTYTVPALGEVLMTLYWDTADVKKGTYDASVFLQFAQQLGFVEQVGKQELTLEVGEESINVVGVGYVISKHPKASGGVSSSLVTILGTIIGVLVLANLAWFLYFRRKMKGNKRYSEKHK